MLLIIKLYVFRYRIGIMIDSPKLLKTKQFIILLLLSLCTFTQAISQSTANVKKEQIKLIGATVLENGVHDNQPVTWLKGNVRFEHEGRFLRCDSAMQYDKQNAIEAFGHVLIKQADTLQLTGDSLTYNGNTARAVMNGHVRMRDNNTTLISNVLDYEIDKKIVSYYNFGRIIDDETRLSSNEGYYDMNLKRYFFRDSVRLKRDSSYIYTDTLQYDLDSNTAHLYGPSELYNGNKYLYAESGYFDTQDNISYFKKQAYVETPEYILTGDSLYYDMNSDYGFAQKNVILFSKKDSVILNGQTAIRIGELSKNIVYDDPLLYKITNKDTVWMKSDTLVFINDTVHQNRRIYAYPHVSFTKGTYSGKCDSLVNNLIDSTMTLYQDPILFGLRDQITADTIKLLTAHNKISKVLTRKNSFIITKDSLGYNNQVKGRNMTANFVDGELSIVTVDGNGECIYHVIQDASKLIGMNKIECSNMKLTFLVSQLKTISFITKPNASFFPPKNRNNTNSRLKDFKNRKAEKPTKESFQKLKMPFIPREKIYEGESTLIKTSQKN